MKRTPLVLMLMAALPASAMAHDLWLWPMPAQAKAPATVDVGLLLGEQGSVETAYFQPARIERLSVGTKPIAVTAPVPGVAVNIAGNATHTVAYVSRPALSELPSDKFDAYLAEEHLTAAIAARSAGTKSGPVREHYSRSVKALIAIEGQSLQDCPVGLPFELSLLPAAAGKISVRATFAGKPLQGTWIDLADGRSVISAEATTDADGIASFAAPSGVAVVRATHMIASTDASVDWRSWWSATTFSLAGGAVKACP